MRIIRDPETVYNCYIQEHVTDFCSQPPSAFHLRFYEEGEFLCSPMQPADCLLLLLDGTIYLYGLNQSGRYLTISARSDVMLLEILSMRRHRDAVLCRSPQPDPVPCSSYRTKSGILG